MVHDLNIRQTLPFCGCKNKYSYQNISQQENIQATPSSKRNSNKIEMQQYYLFS